jgi:hypothetical protein
MQRWLRGTPAAQRKPVRHALRPAFVDLRVRGQRELAR